MCRSFLFAMSWVMLSLGAAASGEPLTIESKSFKIVCAPETGKFTISVPGSDRPFVATGSLAAGGGTGSVVMLKDRAFGDGKAIEITRRDGTSDRIALADKVPFVLFRGTLKNSTAEPLFLNKVTALTVNLDLGKPAESLKTLGTGGLAGLPDEKNALQAGSYMWTAVADPVTRHGVVGGWITSDRASGVVFPSAKQNQPVLRAQAEYGRLQLAPGQAAVSETFALGYFDDARLGLEAWADAVAKNYDIRLPPQPTGYCTWYHAGSWDEKALAQQAAFAGRELKPYGFSVVQIDDGWQDGQTKNGPMKNFTRVRENGPYRSGMKTMADAIRAAGLVPGIWLMPFSGSPEDPWFKDHLDWFVKREDGKPHESPWGGACLDLTQPALQDYLRDEIHRIVHLWGYRYLKMDGLCSGLGVNHVYVNDGYKDDRFGDARLHNPAKTNVEAFRDGLRLIRKAAGPETYVLGCTVAQNMRAYGGAMGLVDAMRVGPDNGPNWNDILTGPRYGTRNYHLHGRIWHNDPDCIYARPSVPLEQAQALASWATLSGQLNISSEDFAKLPAERLDMLRRTMPEHGQTVRPVDLFQQAMPRLWLVSDLGGVRRDVVGLFNWGDKEIAFDESLEYLGLPANHEYLAFDYWGNKQTGTVKDRLQVRVGPRCCLVLAVRAQADHPQLLSTSRHICQGMVDVTGEQWNAAERTLGGVSLLVAGDPYELRIALPVSYAGRKAVRAVVADEDRAAGVVIEPKQDAGLLRVMLRSANSRKVRWSVQFAEN